jgi:uncharacterized phage protein gp47/JayE
MAFPRPTLEQIYRRIIGDVKSSTGLKRVLPKSFVGAFAMAMAAVAHTLYGFIDWCYRQLFPFSQDYSQLVIWARDVKGMSPSESSYAILSVLFPGTNATFIPLGTEFQSPDGILFETEEDFFVVDGEVLITLKAQQAGRSGNIETGGTISLTYSIAGLNSDGIVQSIDSTGEEAETLDSFRKRVLFELQNPPSGGSFADYIRWAKEVPGVTRAWAFPGALGDGSVAVKFVLDGNEDIIPDNDKIAEVQDYINNVRPITAFVEVSAPIPLPLDIEIAISPNNAEVQTAIELEIGDLVLRNSQVSGAYKNEDEVHDGKILLSKIREAVSIAAGEEDNEIISILGEEPANIEPDEFNLVVPGEITWQPI